MLMNDIVNIYVIGLATISNAMHVMSKTWDAFDGKEKQTAGIFCVEFALSSKCVATLH